MIRSGFLASSILLMARAASRAEATIAFSRRRGSPGIRPCTGGNVGSSKPELPVAAGCNIVGPAAVLHGAAVVAQGATNVPALDIAIHAGLPGAHLAEQQSFSSFFHLTDPM